MPDNTSAKNKPVPTTPATRLRPRLGPATGSPTRPRSTHTSIALGTPWVRAKISLRLIESLACCVQGPWLNRCSINWTDSVSFNGSSWIHLHSTERSANVFKRVCSECSDNNTIESGLGVSTRATNASKAGSDNRSACSTETSMGPVKLWA